MHINDWIRMVNRSARLFTIVRNSQDRDEGVDALHQGITKIGFAVDRKMVQRVYDHVRMEMPAA